MPRKGKRENLIPFKPGFDERRNLEGRPKKIPALDELLSNVSDEDYQAIINKLASKAKNGDVRAAEVMLERAFGKAKQSIDVNGTVTTTQKFIVGGKEIEF